MTYTIFSICFHGDSHKTPETHLEKRMKRLWVRIGETLKRLRWKCPCQGLQNGEGAINKAAPTIGANLVISFCPNNKQACDTQCVFLNDNCGLSVRAKSPKIQRFRLCSFEHPILVLLPDLINEQIRKPS